MKIMSIIGARPQFIKSAAVSRALAKNANVSEIILNTDQHFDQNMSGVFLKELNIPRPKYSLNINGLTHGAMVGRMIEKMEHVLIKEAPDIVLVYGDTNSTLAGALASKKLGLKLAHVEAGLRSFDMNMPEEINRVITDRMSDVLFCPTDAAIRNLKNEGFDHFKCRIIKNGDVMKDIALLSSPLAKKPDFDVPDRFILATIHRAENTDDPQRLISIIRAVNRISREIKVIFPVHPRTRKAMRRAGCHTEFDAVEPLGYLEMLYLVQNCQLIMTDSGGLQKEAYFFKKPSVVLRDTTEWVELVESGTTLLTGSDEGKIYGGYQKMMGEVLNFDADLYGDGNASEIIAQELCHDLYIASGLQ